MDKSQYILPKQYEMLTILLPDQGEGEAAAMIDTMQSYITQQNATIDSVHADSPWGRRRLSYSIRHEGVDYRDGHYVLIYFTALPAAIAEIEREMKLDVNVIRYLLLIFDPEMGEKIDPSALAEAESEDAEEAAIEAPGKEEPADEATPAESEEAATDEETPAASDEVTAEEEAPAESEEVATEEDAPAEAEEVASEEEAPAESEKAATEEAAPAESEKETPTGSEEETK